MSIVGPDGNDPLSLRIIITVDKHNRMDVTTQPTVTHEVAGQYLHRAIDFLNQISIIDGVVKALTERKLFEQVIRNPGARP